MKPFSNEEVVEADSYEEASAKAAETLDMLEEPITDMAYDMQEEVEEVGGN